MRLQRPTRRILGLAAALTAGLVASCDAPTKPATHGSIAPRIVLVRDDSAPRATLPLTAVRAIVSGPTNRIVDLTLAGSSWTGRADALLPGSYSVTIEGLANGQVQYFGSVTGVSVVAGNTPASPSIPFTSAVATINPPAQPTGTAFTQNITFSAVAGATGYTVEASKSADFSGVVLSFASATTTVPVTVNDVGTWFLRARPTLPGTNSQVAWSDPRQFEVLASAGGRTVGTAEIVAPPVLAPDTVFNRNLTPVDSVGWYRLSARAGDSLFAETRAARLVPPSALNTVVTLFRADGTTEVATNDNAGTSTDSRVVAVAPATEDYLVKVGRVGTTVGHYELILEIRRLPAAPTALTAVAASGTSVTLDWTDNADNETRFVIERCSGSTCTTFDSVAAVNADVETFTDASLTANGTFRYRVRARNAVGLSAAAGPVTVALVGPAAPSNLTATTISGSRIDLAWTDNSDNETGFEIQRCTLGTCAEGDFTALATVAANVTGFQNTGLALDGTYTYRVRAVNAVVPSAFTATATANTIRPTAPSSLTATTVSATRIDLAWTDNANNESGFSIERCAGQGCGTFAEIATVGAGVTTYADASAAAETFYSYRVRASNVAGFSNYTGVANANTRAPGVPAGFTATVVSATRVDLAWSDTTAAETGFALERCTGAGCTDFAALVTLAAGATAHVDNTVTAGNTYRYRLRATGVAGNSAYASPVQAAVLLPAAPTGLVATTVSGTQVNLAWIDNSDNETRFLIQRCTGVGCSTYADLDSVTAGTTAFSDLTVTVGGVYRYRIRAQNMVGPSAFTAPATASTETAAAPTALTATTIDANRIDLQWVDNAGNETGFRIERCTGAGCSSFTEIATVGADVTSFPNGGIAAGASYSYRVRAYNIVAPSAYTNVATATTSAPAAPTGLAAAVVTAARIDLTWTDASTDEQGFVIERCTGAGCTDFAQIGSVAANATTYADLTTAVGTDYRYRIKAFNVIGESGYATPVDIDTRVPAEPTGLQAITVSGTRIDLVWTDASSNETGFEVERCTGAGCADFATIATLPAGSTSYQDNGVAVDQRYAYRVRAVNNAGSSAPSTEAFATTLLPVAPSGLVATTQSATAIALQWVDNALDANGFIIQRCTGAGCTAFADLDSTSLGQLSFADQTVTAGNTYGYRVLARNIAGRSAPSAPAEANTNVPGTPSDLVATTQSNTQIGLTWTYGGADESGFYIERCTGAGCTDFAIVDSVAADVLAYVSTGLAPSSSFSFRVRAFNASGASAPSAAASATTNLPAIPTGLVATAVSLSEIQLAWTDASTDETGFEIEVCSGAGCSGFTPVPGPQPANSTSFQLSGLDAGQTYRFRIRAVNGAGASDWSNVAQATTSAPNAPTGINGSATSTTTARITWTDQSDNEAAFEVERCTGACIPSALVGTVGAGVTTFDDTGLTPGETYTYRVRAVNQVGQSGYTDLLVISTALPAAPTGLTATTITSSRIDLAWVDNATNETAYEIERCQGAACTDFGAIDTVAANVASFSDEGLPANVAFQYRVRALNGAGPSAYSNVAGAATDVPADPTGLVAVAQSGTAIRIDWVDNANNETDFVIQRCGSATCAEADFADLQLVGANVTTYLDGTLAAGDTATYRVKAINLNGESRYSNAATASTTIPLAPTGLTSTTVNGTRIDLAWTDNAADETGFEVERCPGVAPCGGYARIDSVGPNVTAYQDLTAQLNAVYSYRVRALNRVGVTAYTAEATSNTILPATAANLAAQTVTASRIDLTWADVADNEFGYRIERCAGDGCGDFATLVTTAPDAQAHSDLTVVLGQSYSYRVFAFNAAGDASPAGPVTATTLVPADPANLAATVTAPTTIRLTWTDAATNELGYRIERCTGVSCTSFVELTTVGTDVVEFDNAGLASNTFYRYRIRAFNAAGTSAYSAVVTVNTFAPAAPSGLAATTVFGNRIDLQWTDASSNETGFRIERCAGAGCTTFTEVATVGANVTSHADSTLAFDTDYRYQVRSYNGVANSAPSNVADGNTRVPVDPSALTAEATSTTSIALAWNDNAGNETGFRVERCAGPGCSDFALVATLAANTTSYADSPIASNTSFTYRIRAFNAGQSGYSNVATATTILPVAPTDAAAIAVAGDRVDLSWTDNADNEYGFRIERCTGAACTDFIEVATVAANVGAYSDQPLAGGLLYRYRIRAYNGAGPSAYTAVVEATTNVPGIPTSLSATTMTASQINLAWTDNATDELGFVIERCVGGGCTDFAVRDSVQAPDATGYNDVGLSASTAYRYRVRAYNASGVSGASNVAAASTNTPADPSALVATTVSATRIELTWADNADNELAVEIERCTGAGCTDFAPLVTVAANVTTYADETATINTVYTYRVRMTNNAGVSGYSATAEANTLVPADPAGLVATTLAATRIGLAWNDNADNEVTYRVERCVGAGCSTFTELVTLPANTTGHVDAGLTPNESYTYRVRAVNVSGASGYTAEATATTAIPSDPSGLLATTVSATQVDLAWADNSTNELQFVIERCDTAACDGSVVQVGTAAANATAFSDLTVAVDNVYHYRVRASNAAGTSGASNVATASTLRPTAPDGLMLLVTTATRVDLVWNDASDNEQRFVIERCAGAGCGAFTPVDSVGAGAVAFADQTVTAGNEYTYRVRAVNAAGSSAPSASVLTATSAPAAPSGLAATTLSESQVQLDWTDNSFNESEFVLSRCVEPSCGSFSDFATVPPGVTTYQVADLVIGNSYRFLVRAVNGAGASGNSNEAAATTLLPNGVNDLAAVVAAPDRIDLAWTDNSGNEAGYRIERCTGTGCDSFVEIFATAADATTFQDTDVALNTAYSYRIRAYNAVGPADYSNTASENTFVPASPSGVTATAVTVNQVNLAWTDAATNETEYQVEVCQAGTECPSFTALVTLPAGTTAYAHATAPNVNYLYRIRALRANVGASAFTESNIASTILNAPTYIRAQTVLRNRIDVSWNDNSTIETGYRVLACLGVACVPNAVVANLGPNATSHQQLGLSTGQTYSFAVQAVSNTTFSSPTAAAGAYTPVVMGNGTTYAVPADSQRAERYFVLAVPSTSPEVRFTMTQGVGEVDLHVRRSLAPTLFEWECRPYPINATETCFAPTNFPLLAGGGDYYAMPHAYQAMSGATMKGSFAERWGYPNAFAGTAAGWNVGFTFAQQITISRATTVTHLGLIAPAPAGTINIALYSNRAGGTTGSEPGTLLTQTTAGMAAGLQEYSTPNVTIAAGTYWIVFQMSQFNTLNQDTGGITTTWKYFSAPYGTPLPAVWPLAASLGGTYNDYVRERMNFFVRAIP